MTGFIEELRLLPVRTWLGEGFVWLLWSTLYFGSVWGSQRLTKKIIRQKFPEALQKLSKPFSYLFFGLSVSLFILLSPFPEILDKRLLEIVFVLNTIFLMACVRAVGNFGLQWILANSGNAKSLQKGFLPLMRNILSITTLLTGIIMILTYFKYDVFSLLTALGVGSLTVGLASRDILSHLISGFVLILDRRIRPGDRVNFEGAEGEIVEIGLRSTLLKLESGSTLIIPNSELVNKKIITLEPDPILQKSQILFSLPLGTELSKIEPLCQQALGRISEMNAQFPWTLNLLSFDETKQEHELSFVAPKHLVPQIKQALLENFQKEKLYK